MNEPRHPSLKNSLSNLDRRHFMALLSSAAAAFPLASLAARREQAGMQGREQALAEPWLTLAAVQQHLFPAEHDSPGASDIRAIDYLQNMMQAPDIDDEEKNFIQQGVSWLNDIARKGKSAAFVALDEEHREQVLRSIEKSRAGERWLSLMLSYLLEALLSDPVYGGNPDGIGWQWLEHQPGFPAPTENKIYYKLAQRHSFKRTRA